jgi:hypothetical protein
MVSQLVKMVEDLRNQLHANQAASEAVNQQLRNQLHANQAASEAVNQQLRDEMRGIQTESEAVNQQLRDEMRGIQAASEAADQQLRKEMLQKEAALKADIEILEKHVIYQHQEKIFLQSLLLMSEFLSSVERVLKRTVPSVEQVMALRHSLVHLRFVDLTDVQSFRQMLTSVIRVCDSNHELIKLIQELVQDSEDANLRRVLKGIEASRQEHAGRANMTPSQMDATFRLLNCGIDATTMSASFVFQSGEQLLQNLRRRNASPEGPDENPCKNTTAAASSSDECKSFASVAANSSKSLANAVPSKSFASAAALSHRAATASATAFPASQAAPSAPAPSVAHARVCVRSNSGASTAASTATSAMSPIARQGATVLCQPSHSPANSAADSWQTVPSSKQAQRGEQGAAAAASASSARPSQSGSANGRSLSKSSTHSVHRGGGRR